MVVSQEKLAHFLDFITGPHIIQDLPFGEIVSLSTKEVIKIPNVVRNMIPERIVQQYQAYSKEENVTPLSRSTLLRVLQVCPASTRKSLQGIDYISSAGAQAFDNLESVAEKWIWGCLTDVTQQSIYFLLMFSLKCSFFSGPSKTTRRRTQADFDTCFRTT